jgi:hypothetical protein
MSGIVGSKFNIRGSGLVGSLGTDGQHFLSSGAGKTNVFETIAAAGGAWNKIKTLTASSSATLSFVNGTSDVVFDGTYDYYIFVWTSIHAQTDAQQFSFQFSIDTGSNYNTNILSNYHVCYVNGSGADHTLETKTGNQDGTGFQRLTSGQDAAVATSTTSGTLQVWDPGSTTFWKHFISEQAVGGALGVTDYQLYTKAVGRSETTSAIDAIQFKMSSGNVDAGKISMYGVTN